MRASVVLIDNLVIHIHFNTAHMFVAERSHELCRRAPIVQTITLLHTVFQESFTVVAHHEKAILAVISRFA
jgi:hypothetical protein